MTSAVSRPPHPAVLGLDPADLRVPGCGRGHRGGERREAGLHRREAVDEMAERTPELGLGDHPRVPVLELGWGTALAAHDGVIDGRAQEVRLCVELEVDGLNGDASACRHGSHRRGGEAALTEELIRGGSDPRSRRVGACAPGGRWFPVDVGHGTRHTTRL